MHNKYKLGEGTFIEHHVCGACDCSVGYIIILGNVYFDSGCGCSRYNTKPHMRTWDELDAFLDANPEKIPGGIHTEEESKEAPSW